ncbi:MAG: gamma carbonic anhydrase family protein [Bdellovibrionales bacterium]|nr:gamma carbonic anhydrase family protein [Bdellovibrionales bacterium]
MIETVRGKNPIIGKNTFVASTAQIIGDVKVGEDSSLWYQTVLRGDVMPIIIGNETNIQDGSIIHGTFKKCGTEVGNRVTVGHGVILHGCKIGDLCLIGMGSLVMDLAQIGERCIVGAGSLVTEEAKFPSGVLILGRPARVIRELTAEELAFLDKSANNYIEYKSWYNQKDLK